MEVCSECETPLDSSLRFCPNCGAKNQNIVEASEVILKMDPVTKNEDEEKDEARNRQIILGSIGVIAILALYLLSSSEQTYTLQYEVTANHGGEEFSVYYEYTTPDGETEGGFFDVVPGCSEAITCNHMFEIDFEYKEAFQTEFTISCYGCEGDPPSVCIETFVDYYSIGLDCGFYSNPDDDLNFAIITDSAYVNKQVIDKV